MERERAGYHVIMFPDYQESAASSGRNPILGLAIRPGSCLNLHDLAYPHVITRRANCQSSAALPVRNGLIGWGAVLPVVLRLDIP